MSDPDDVDEIGRSIRRMNEGHGYGGIFNHANEADKRNVELYTANEWCKSIRAEFGLVVEEPKLNPHDPPDCFVTFEGECLGVELVQLIEENHKGRASRDETPYGGKLFEDMQWSEKRLVSRLNEVIQKKGAQYGKTKKHIDVLLIHTAETWLNPRQAKTWLANIRLMRHANISNGFLLFEYEPGRGVDHWPLIYLFGDKLHDLNEC